MTRWYEIPDSARSDEQKVEQRTAYYQTLLAIQYGREFLADCRRRVREVDITIGGEKAVTEIYILDAFLRETRELCGPVDEMAIIEAEQKVANRAVAPEQPKTIPGFREQE